MAEPTGASGRKPSDRPTADEVRRTFMEFWSPELCRLALPHRRVDLDTQEALAVAACHRKGPDARGAIGILRGAAKRIDEVASDFPGGWFLRMGYGSWSASQVARFGTLRVRPPMGALDVLSLRDRRLATIVRRYGRGFAPGVFVRPFLDFRSDAELRVPVARGTVDRPVWREPAKRGIEAVGDAEAAAAAALVAAALGHLPDLPLHVDVVETAGIWRIVDINPRL